MELLLNLMEESLSQTFNNMKESKTFYRFVDYQSKNLGISDTTCPELTMRKHFNSLSQLLRYVEENKRDLLFDTKFPTVSLREVVDSLN